MNMKKTKTRKTMHNTKTRKTMHNLLRYCSAKPRPRLRHYCNNHSYNTHTRNPCLWHNRNSHTIDTTCNTISLPQVTYHQCNTSSAFTLLLQHLRHKVNTNGTNPTPHTNGTSLTHTLQWQIHSLTTRTTRAHIPLLQHSSTPLIQPPYTHNMY